MRRRAKDFDYQTYLASREWSLLREQVRERSRNVCEHCFHAPQQAVHHLTYANLGNEVLRDLMAVCNPCHAYFSAKSSVNPNDEWSVTTPALEIDTVSGPWHYILPISAPDAPERVRQALCYGPGCVWCKEADSFWPLFLTDLLLPQWRPRQ